MREVVYVHKLVKIYKGGIRALDGISFSVRRGEIFGIIGPNGAGKTTTLRILATLLRPTSGIVKVYGYDVIKEARKIRELIGYLPEEAGAYKNLTGIEYLRFNASFYAKDEKDLKDTIKRGMEISGLGERLHDKIKTYSKGMLRRLLIARTLMIKPKLALLDEPTSGIDVSHAFFIRKTIREYSLKYNTTIVVSSHNMLEVEYLCDRVCILNKGRILVKGSPSELKKKYQASNLEEVFVKVARL